MADSPLSVAGNGKPKLGESTMAETAQINFELRELTVALIRLHGIREGNWTLGFEFAFGAANVGQSQADVKPSAFVAVKTANLSRQPADAPDLPFTVDAAEVNPAAADDKEPAPPVAPKKRG